MTAKEFLLGLMKLLELDSDDGCTILQILKKKKNPLNLKKKKKERWDKPSADSRNGRMRGASTVSVSPITFLR